MKTSPARALAPILAVCALAAACGGGSSQSGGSGGYGYCVGQAGYCVCVANVGDNSGSCHWQDLGPAGLCSKGSDGSCQCWGIDCATTVGGCTCDIVPRLSSIGGGSQPIGPTCSGGVCCAGNACTCLTMRTACPAGEAEVPACDGDVVVGIMSKQAGVTVVVACDAQAL